MNQIHSRLIKRIAILSYGCAFSAGLFVSCRERTIEASTPEQMAQYIEACSAKEIKANGIIEVYFKGDALPGIPSTLSPNKRMMKFTPSLKGQEIWVGDECKLLFYPKAGQLKAGRNYTCQLHLDALIPGAEDIAFSFSVEKRASEMEITEVCIPNEDPETAVICGKVALSEPVEDGVVIPELFKTSAACKAATTIQRLRDDTFLFKMRGFRRSKDGDTAVKVYFDAAAIGFGERMETAASIPGKECFKVISADWVQASEPYFSIQFSAPLSENQALDGLVYLEEMETSRIERDGSQVKLFFKETDAPTITLAVERTTKNRQGEILASAYRKTFRSTGIRPAVELLVKDGILPDEGNLKLPFKSVNLCAVDVSVIKIFRSNVLSFYQDNGIGGTYNLRRYGRLVYKKTARLDKDPDINLHQWQNFSIDLKNLFRQEKGAIYRIKLTFKQAYSLYDGSAAPAALPDASITPAEEAVWDEGFPWYETWSEFRSDEWRWREREDPTKPSYYMVGDRFPEINLVASPIGVIVKKADDARLWITTTDLVSSSPMGGVKITAYNYQLKPVGESVSNGSGFAEMILKGKPYIIQAERGNAVTHLKMPDSEKNLSRFDVGGKTVTNGLKGYAYGERGVWRPGDTLHLTLVVEDKHRTLPASHPATMELYTPDDRLYGTTTLPSGKDGFYAFETATAANSPTGTWHAVFSVGGARFSMKVPIETIKPNRLKINLSTDSETIRSGEEETLSVSSRWLTGPAASCLDGTLDIVLHPTSVPFPEFRGFVFSHPLKSYTTENLEQIPFRLDSIGNAIITRKMPEAKEAPGMLKADLVCKISEPGGNTSTVANTVRFSPFSHYAGIDLKETDYETDKDLGIRVISVDPDGKAVAGRTLEYKIYRLEWNWWWECDARKLDRYISGETAKKEASGTVTSSEHPVAIPFSLPYPDYGKFLILVQDVQSGHTTGGTFFVDWPSWRGHSDKSDPEALSMLSFTTDKKSYEVGETATVYLPVAEGGHALVSFENAAGVLSRSWVSTSGSAETAWKFRITDKMAPNFYLHITLLQPHRQTVNDLPIRMYGVRNVDVSNPDSHLTPVIECPDIVRPQTPFTIKVKEKAGKAMTYTLAIVDEGLLDLTAFKTPDPWTAMNEREALGVRTWDMYDDVIGAYAGKFTQVLSLGGDMAIRGTKKENRFRPVVKYLGPFTLHRGTGTHKIQLPMYLGSVRVMVVSGHAGAYGHAEKSVIVRSPLMVLPTLPRRLSMGETVKLPVNVFALEPGVKDVVVQVSAEGPLKMEGAAEKRLRFGTPGDSLVAFSLRAAGNESGQAKVTVSASGNGCQALETIHIDIVNPNPLKSESFCKMLSPGAQTDFTWPGREPEEGESVVLEAAGFPSIDFSDAFHFVHSYGHLCTEQLASRAFFLLYARDFLDAADRSEAEKMIPDILAQLVSRQMPDGGFSYWEGGGSVYPWAVSMAGQVLLEAQKQGFAVLQQAIDNWVKFQKEAIRQYQHDGRKPLDDLDEAYRLYTLALAKKPDIGAMNRLKESPGISVQARWRLAAAYSVTGKAAQAASLTEDSLISIAAPSNGIGDTWWSALRDKAMILDALVETGCMDQAMLLAQEVAGDFSCQHASTQELAWTSRAMGSLARAAGTSDMNLSIRQDDAHRDIQGGHGVIVQALDAKAGKVRVMNNGTSPVYTYLTVRQRAGLEEAAAASSNGVNVSVEWQTLDGAPLSVEEIKQGTEFRAVIMVNETTGSTYSESMALTFTAPSGWEIWNDRLWGGMDDNGIYRDIRDNELRWYFPLGAGSRRHFYVRLQAAYEGVFRLPEILCEDMYNARYKSNTAGGTVCVSR